MAFETRILDNQDMTLLEEFYLQYEAQTHLSMNLKLDLSPDIREAVKVLGNDTRYLAVIDKNKGHIACACALSLKKCYIQGTCYTMGYMSGLKARREYMGSTVFACFMRGFNAYWKEVKAVCWIFSVFTENDVLNRLLQKEHSLFAPVEILTGYRTFLFRPHKLKLSFPVTGDYITRYARPEDLDAIQNYLRKQFIMRDLMPAYTESEILDGTGLLNKFPLTNLALTLKNNSIAGMAGIWDQSEFRRWYVESYSHSYRFLRPLINIGAGLSGMPFLPRPGVAIPYKLISLLLIDEDDPAIFCLLYKQLLSLIAYKDLVSVGLTEQNPLNPLFRNKCYRLDNSIYIGYHKEYSELIAQIRKTTIYIEQGGL